MKEGEVNGWEEEGAQGRDGSSIESLLKRNRALCDVFPEKSF